MRYNEYGKTGIKLSVIGLGGAKYDGCHYCDNVCPQNISIPAYMQFYNQKHIFGMPDDVIKKKLEFARKWFMLASRKADAKDCSQCRNCEEQCTQKLDISNRMKFLGDLEADLQ